MHEDLAGEMRQGEITRRRWGVRERQLLEQTINRFYGWEINNTVCKQSCVCGYLCANVKHTLESAISKSKASEHTHTHTYTHPLSEIDNGDNRIARAPPSSLQQEILLLQEKEEPNHSLHVFVSEKKKYRKRI